MAVAHRFRWIAPLLFTIVIGAHLAFVIPSMLTQRLWEDEAFNLTVPLNLVAGLGYTSDGTLSGSELTPFDVRISTGPVVLLPIALLHSLGVEPVLAGRIVAAVFWMLLIVGLAVLGRRAGTPFGAGGFGAVAAATVPLTLYTNHGHSPIQGPADILGEPAAAALIVWAIIALRRRPLLAALIAGLAIQAKFIALLALPALALGLLVSSASPPRRWFATLWRPALVAIVPTALYELVALIQLGFDGFFVHAKQFVGFLLSGGQAEDPTTFLQKMGFLMSNWFIPEPLAWIVLLVGITFTASSVAALVRNRRSQPSREILAVFVIAAVCLATYLVWWGTASHTPLWIRHPSPALLSCVPTLAAFAVAGIARFVGISRPAVSVASADAGDARPAAPARALGVSRSALGRTAVRRILGTVALVSFLALITFQGTAQLQQAYAPREETLQMQRSHAATLAEHLDVSSRDGHTWVAADPWGSAVSIIVLTGAHVGLSDAPAMEHTLKLSAGACTTGPALAASGPYELCG